MVFRVGDIIEPLPIASEHYSYTKIGCADRLEVIEIRNGNLTVKVLPTSSDPTVRVGAIYDLCFHEHFKLVDIRLKVQVLKGRYGKASKDTKRS